MFLVALAALILVEFRLFYQYIMFEYHPKPREAIFFLKVVGLGAPVFAAFLSLGSCLAPRRVRRLPRLAIVFVALGALVGAVWLGIDARKMVPGQYYDVENEGWTLLPLAGYALGVWEIVRVVVVGPLARRRLRRPVRADIARR